MIVWIIIFLFPIFITTVFYRLKFSYWKKKNIPFFRPSIPFGNIKCPLTRTKHLSVTLKEIYQKAKLENLKHLGLYYMTRPLYLPLNLEIIKTILTKNFDNFSDRGVYYNESQDPLTAHLFAIEGKKWKPLRIDVNKTFTPARLKSMFLVLQKSRKYLQNLLEENLAQSPVNIKEIVGYFTTDTIGAAAFGLDFKSVKNENCPIRKFRNKLFTSGGFVNNKWKILRRPLVTAYPSLARLFNVKLVEKDVSDFFIYDLVKKLVEYRQNLQKTQRPNDFIQHLIDIHSNSTDDVGLKLTVEEIAAHCFIFFLAGFETPSIAVSFALYELAKNQKIQEKVRQEILHVLDKYHGDICYEAMNDLKYMNQVIDETLRMYPPSAYITRRCIKDCKIDETLTIEKNTLVIIPVLGIHYDEEYYPEPDVFDPVRFSDENRALRPHYTHLPFGEGPRKCLGFRFGLLQTKVALTSLLKDYIFSINKKTQEPLRFQVNPTMLGVEGDIWMDANKL